MKSALRSQFATSQRERERERPMPHGRAASSCILQRARDDFTRCFTTLASFFMYLLIQSFFFSFLFLLFLQRYQVSGISRDCLNHLNDTRGIYQSNSKLSYYYYFFF
ncbi:hypothetical protein PUN28_002865 [Cardiocondyla obscurior]|uniref:Uncharacterized protein n=1 Tax=Cardiocondyla obscurior TaxID=286306 RepID=A0AAW2GWR5_9HYME